MPAYDQVRRLLHSLTVERIIRVMLVRIKDSMCFSPSCAFEVLLAARGVTKKVLYWKFGDQRGPRTDVRKLGVKPWKRLLKSPMALPAPPLTGTAASVKL